MTERPRPASRCASRCALDIAFDYRIVAEPIDGSGVRLPSAPHLATAQFTRKSVTRRGDFNAKKGVQRY